MMRYEGIVLPIFGSLGLVLGLCRLGGAGTWSRSEEVQKVQSCLSNSVILSGRRNTERKTCNNAFDVNFLKNIVLHSAS